MRPRSCQRVERAQGLVEVWTGSRIGLEARVHERRQRAGELRPACPQERQAGVELRVVDVQVLRDRSEGVGPERGGEEHDSQSPRIGGGVDHAPRTGSRAM